MKLLGRIRHPPCAVCRKPVEGLLVEQSRGDGSLTFVVWCHGATESVTLTEDMLDGAVEVTVGMAFARPALADQGRSASVPGAREGARPGALEAPRTGLRQPRLYRG